MTGQSKEKSCTCSCHVLRGIDMDCWCAGCMDNHIDWDNVILPQLKEKYNLAEG